MKEDYRGSYICILTFTHVTTRRSLRFQSEETFKSKAEAKESAAKVAVLSLGILLIVGVWSMAVMLTSSSIIIVTLGILLHTQLVKCYHKWVLSIIVCKYFYTDEETIPSRVRGNPKNGSSGSGGDAVAVDQEKNPISWLKEYCEGKKIPQPQYEEVKCGGQQFKWRVIVEGKSFEGMPCNKKQDAKKAAAQKAVNVLQRK